MDNKLQGSLLVSGLTKSDEEIAENLKKARIFMVLAVISITVYCLTAKILSYRYNIGYYALSITMFRMLVLFIFSLLRFKSTQTELPDYTAPDPEMRKWLIIRVVSIVINSTTASLSLFYLKVGTAVVIGSVNPIMSMFVSSCVLNERIDKRYILSCIVSLIGILMITFSSQGTLSDNNESNLHNTIYGTMLALLTAFSFTFVTITSKTLAKTYSSEQINYLSGLHGFILSLIILLFFRIKTVLAFLDPFYLFFNLILGGCTVFSYFCMNTSLKKVDVSKVAYLLYLQIPLVTILEFVLLPENYSILEFIGMMIVFSTLMYTTFYFK